MAADEPRALETGNDSAHRGRANLFGVGQLPERPKSPEDQDGESGKLGGTDATFAVADTEAPQKVDRGGVELVGDVDCGQRRGGGRRRR